MLNQFACQVTDFSSQYGSDNTISYTAGNATGKPTVYPNYGDSNHSFAFRTYGPWWTASKFHNSHKDVPFQDILEIKVEKEICPCEFKIYETYNPGAVTRILAYNTKFKKWIVLWEGRPQCAQPLSRIFSPMLRSNNFLTSVFRIEFCHCHLDYYYEVDAFEVSGTLVEFRNHVKITESTDDESESRECSVVKGTSVTSLPSEVFNLVLSYLNLKTLCRASQVSTFFKKHCYDSVLYQRLNLQPFWHQVNNSALNGLMTRCQFLQELNLACCGSQISISPDVFINFVQHCGRNLLHLDLSNCPFLDSECLSVITRTSLLLESLSLKNNVYNSGFTQTLHQISSLKRLQCLNLYRTHIDVQSLVEIITACHNLQHLNLGSCSKLNNYDEVAFHIGSKLHKLKSLDLWRARTLSSLGIQYICNGCPELEDFDVGWCDFIDTSTGCIQQLAMKCPKLKRLILSSIRMLSNTDLLSVAVCCSNLEQIDILGTRDITPPAVEQFLFSSRNLKLLDVSFSAQLDPSHVASWTAMFPNIAIKQSCKPLLL